MSALTAVSLTLCQPCLEGAGGECHTPGCSLWMNRAPDIPVDAAPLDIVGPQGAAAILNVSRSYVYRMIKEGSFPAPDGTMDFGRRVWHAATIRAYGEARNA